MNPTESNRDAMLALGRQARKAAKALALADTARKNAALVAMATAIRDAAPAIAAANALDLDAAKSRDLKASFLDRLTLTPARIEAMAPGAGRYRQACRSGGRGPVEMGEA